MSPEILKLYQSNSSPNSRRVRMFLAEKGVSVITVPVDLGAGEQFSPAYSAINARQVVPTLVLADGTAIGEAPAISRYLEETFPERPLLGATPRDKALVTMWERRMELEGFAAVMETVRNAVPGLKGRAIAGPHDYDQIAALVDRGRLRIADFYRDLDTRLAETAFVAGAQFSAADITALVTVDFATKAADVAAPQDFKALSAWYGSVSKRPSAAA
jgi:glutathione S-transferase